MKREATLNAIRYAALLALLLGGSVFSGFCYRQRHPPSPQSAGDTVLGRVVGVLDGDTITVLDAAKVEHRIRLYGIDAPESTQDYGAKAKLALSSLVFGKEVQVVVRAGDRYGRTVGQVYSGDTYANRVMVENGMAWWYEHDAPQDTDVKDAEQKAKEAKLGLWAAANPLPPWEWRRRQKDGH